MADAKLTVTIAGQCLTFAGWKFIDSGVYQNGLKHVQILGQVDSPSLRIQECDENADELGELYYAQTIGEFRDVLSLIVSGKYFKVENSINWETFQERLENTEYDLYFDRDNKDRLLCFEDGDFPRTSTLDDLFGGNWQFVQESDDDYIDEIREYFKAKI